MSNLEAVMVIAGLIFWGLLLAWAADGRRKDKESARRYVAEKYPEGGWKL